MSKSDFYKQCVLHRELPGGGTAVLTSWIEERFAVVGKRVYVKDDPDFPEDDIFTVSEVGLRQSAKWVTDRQKAHERWRKVTDV